jgi:hypothetical protein
MARVPDSSPGLPTWLFVAYGGGHIAMVLPVAQRIKELGLARPVVLALTTAQGPSRAAGLETIGFADFIQAGDERALAKGRELAAALGGPVSNPVESAAYLGLSYADLEAQAGVEGARQAYETFGRQCFHPVPTLRRILQSVAPVLVVATNSPRAERACIDAAGQLSIASVCLVDLFAVDEKKWIGRPGYARRVCVLNEAVRQTLLAEGRGPDEVVVTGNPAFDGLFDPAHRLGAAGVRERLTPGGEKLALYAPSPEPLRHPLREQAGNDRLPHEVLEQLLEWAATRPDVVLAVRPHPSQAQAFSVDGVQNAVLTGQDWPLEPLLHASDAVCITVSTVGLQGWLIGKPVVQVPGSMFDEGAPFSRMGMATRAPLAGVGAAMARALAGEGTTRKENEPAVPRVVEVLRQVANL